MSNINVNGIQVSDNDGELLVSIKYSAESIGKKVEENSLLEELKKQKEMVKALRAFIKDNGGKEYFPLISTKHLSKFYGFADVKTFARQLEEFGIFEVTQNKYYDVTSEYSKYAIPMGNHTYKFKRGFLKILEDKLLAIGYL